MKAADLEGWSTGFDGGMVVGGVRLSDMAVGA